MNNKTMMQYFEWYQPDDGLFWKRCAAQAEKLKEKGIDMVWLPPAYKGTSSADVGYGVYDLYDLGEFDQKGTVRTKYGTIDEYKEAVSAFQENGIEVVADIVLNHRMGADRTEPVLATPMSPTERNKPTSPERSRPGQALISPAEIINIQILNGTAAILTARTWTRPQAKSRSSSLKAKSGSMRRIRKTSILTI